MDALQVFCLCQLAIIIGLIIKIYKLETSIEGLIDENDNLEKENLNQRVEINKLKQESIANNANKRREKNEHKTNKR